jgi:aminobenzoyl-glutamate utilization protein B
VDNCAKGAALMTGTSVEIELVSSCKEMKVNRVLAELYYQAMTKGVIIICAVLIDLYG